MANVFIENATLQNIANAIRNKTGKTGKMLPAEMPVEIESIQAGGGGGLKYTSGTVEFADNNNCIFYHNFGAIPRFLYIWTDETTERIDACLAVFYASILPRDLYGVLEDRTSYSRPLYHTDFPQVLKELTDTYAKIAPRNSSFPIRTGVTYNWLVIE